jgi:hypothetical protein
LQRGHCTSRVHIHFFLAALRDVFFVLAFLFGAARVLAATLFATFFFAGEAVASALAPLTALTCIAVATVPKTALAAAVEAAFAVAPAVAATLATSPTSTLVLSAALFPAAKTVSRAFVMVPLRFISDPPSFLAAINGLRWTCPLYPKKRVFAVQKQCPLWVISGHFAMRERCPLYSQKRTYSAYATGSAARPVIVVVVELRNKRTTDHRPWPGFSISALQLESECTLLSRSIARKDQRGTNSPNKIDPTINANVRTIAVTQPMTRLR